MSAPDAYAPCPCGSGQKFKWCCQKVEAYAERAERLLERGQLDSALAAIEEGLRKAPDSAWLLTRKAAILLRQGKSDFAAEPLEKVLAASPGHPGALGLYVRVVLENEGPDAGAAQLQQALSACPPEARQNLGPITEVVGLMLNDAGHVPAAWKHMELARRLLGDDPMVDSAIRMIEGNPGTAPWLRNPYRLSPAPQGLTREQSDRFAQGLSLADGGLWASAAAVFEILSGARITDADRNVGLTRLWTADNEAAVAALRRHIASAGETTDAVDLEALSQLVAPAGEDDLVDHVHLIWPIKKRSELLAALQASDRVVADGRGPMDPDDPNSFEVDQFSLLDQPKPNIEKIADLRTLPRIIGRVLVASEIVMLDAFDDGRISNLMDRFIALAQGAIPPAHPKTKVIDKVSRSVVALMPEWWLPEGASRDEADRLRRLERKKLIRETWIETPMPFLRGRTPRQAAKAGDAKVALRAAVCQLEFGHEFFRDDLDFAALRSDLGIEPEPPIDAATADIGAVHLGRLHLITADQLDDERLIALWARARTYVLPLAMERSARALVERQPLLDREDVGRVTVYSDLANLALSRHDTAEALDWLAQGRRDEPADQKAKNAVRWDMVEVRLRARSEPPESWVPQLVVALERYRDDQASNQVILASLMDMGLVQMLPHPDSPDQLLVDSRPLQAVLTRYGPKITTATGELGISATRGGLWTPGQPTGGGSSGGIWTPGSAAPPSGGEDKPKLIIPGR